MNIRTAVGHDIETLLRYDKHICKTELQTAVTLGRVLIMEADGSFAGLLRWNLFWDSIPFMNMLYLIRGCRGKGYGKMLVTFWEKAMREKGHSLVMTSTLSSESAQHFYRKLDYVEAGSLLLKGEPLEIIFTKELP